MPTNQEREHGWKSKTGGHKVDPRRRASVALHFCSAALIAGPGHAVVRICGANSTLAEGLARPVLLRSSLSALLTSDMARGIAPKPDYLGRLQK